jgi:hypothetical protein
MSAAIDWLIPRPATARHCVTITRSLLVSRFFVVTFPMPSSSPVKVLCVIPTPSRYLSARPLTKTLRSLAEGAKTEQGKGIEEMRE